MKPDRILVVAPRSLTAFVLPAALLVLTCTTAEAGDHQKRVLVGYVPVTPYYTYGYAAAPVAAAAVGYYYAGAAAGGGRPAPVAGAPRSHGRGLLLRQLLLRRRARGRGAGRYLRGQARGQRDGTRRSSTRSPI